MFFIFPSTAWLTLTWDVFKFYLFFSYNFVVFWLTLTWDVFKLETTEKAKQQFKRLTLTWDVFKLMEKNYLALF